MTLTTTWTPPPPLAWRDNAPRYAPPDCASGRTPTPLSTAMGVSRCRSCESTPATCGGSPLRSTACHAWTTTSRPSSPTSPTTTTACSARPHASRQPAAAVSDAASATRPPPPMSTPVCPPFTRTSHPATGTRRVRRRGKNVAGAAVGPPGQRPVRRRPPVCGPARRGSRPHPGHRRGDAPVRACPRSLPGADPAGFGRPRSAVPHPHRPQPTPDRPGRCGVAPPGAAADAGFGPQPGGGHRQAADSAGSSGKTPSTLRWGRLSSVTRSRSRR